MLQSYCKRCHLDLPLQSNYCFKCGDFVNVRGVAQPGQTTQHSDQCVLPPNYFSQAAQQQNPQRPTPAPSQPAPNPNVAPGIPAALMEKMQQARQSIEGERRLVSILFADISGFTAMSEKLDPERVTDIINECFRRLGKCVYDYEGYIDKFMGDCIMALFGAPIAHENDPELAINAALAIQQELAQYNQDENLDLGISIGINAGIVIAGGVGTNEQFTYTVMGDAVNVAQRLESAAGSGEIYVSKTIYSSTERAFEFKELEPVRLKGKEQPVEVYSVLGKAKPGASSRPSQVSSKNLIGREKEVEIAYKLIDSAKNGRGQVFLVTGEAGVGKSRLKHELRSALQGKGFKWFESKCQTLHRESVYWPFKQLLEEILHIESETSFERQKQNALKIKDFELDSVSESLILDMLGFSEDDEQNLQLDAAQRKRAVFLAFRKLLNVLASNQPVSIYLEDLHWMDALSKELLEYLIDGIPNQGILIYCSFRPDFSHDWHSKANVTQIALEPLTTEQSIGLVKALLKIDDIPDSLEEIIRNRADGNPLYIEEIIKSLIDAGKIYDQNGKWNVVDDIENVQIPTTLQGLIASRIDRLRTDTKQVLQYASVVGRQFSDLVLSKASGLETQLQDSLAYLRKKELIFELASEIDEIVYIFKHALTQEVAYESILKKHRRAFHQRVAITIENLYREEDRKLNEFYEALAHHFNLAESYDKAIFYLYRSAEKMASNYDNSGAIDFYEQAASLIEEHQPHETQLLSELLSKCGDIYRLIGDYDAAQKTVERIYDLAIKIDDKQLQAKAKRSIGLLYRLRGQLEPAIKYLQEAIDLADRANDFEGKIRTLKVLGLAFEMQQNSEEAEKCLTQGLDGARALNNQQIVAEYLNDFGIFCINRAKLDQAEKYIQESIEISRESPRLKSLLVSSVLNMGVIEYFRKDFSKALRQFREAAKVSEQIGDLKNSLISYHNIGEILKEYGKYEEALVEFERSYQVAIDIGDEIEQLNNQILIGYLKTLLSEKVSGEVALLECVERAKAKERWLYYCDALFYLGLYYKQEDQPDKALQSFKVAHNTAVSNNFKNIVEKIQQQMNELNLKSDKHPIKRGQKK